MKKAIKVVTTLAFSMATLFIASASANNGIQFYEDGFDDGTYWVECLGEEVNVYQSIVGAYHEFETPAGTYHLVDNWRSTVMWTGMSTGRTWVGRNSSPFQENIGPGETSQFVFKGVQKPLTGDGPKFFYGTEFKVTVTANGDMVVERVPEEPFGARIRCLGKN